MFQGAVLFTMQQIGFAENAEDIAIGIDDRQSADVVIGKQPHRRRDLVIRPNPTSPTEGVGRRQAAEILGMQLQRSALQGMSAQSTSRLFRVVIFGGG
jgi:hypothetical protein